jgi:glycosyltransferase involved in cell wall biosynthesis
MKRILLLSKYGAWEENANYRFYQHIPHLKEKGLNIIPLPLYSNNIEESLLNKDFIPLSQKIFSFAKRIWNILRNQEPYILWLDQEVIPFLPFGLENLLFPIDTPIYLDIYNSNFYKYSHGSNFITKFFLKNKMPFWIARSEFVSVSTPKLLEYAREWNPNTELLPLSLNETYLNTRVSSLKNQHEILLGWTGSKFTARFLKTIEEPIKELARYFPLKLIAIGSESTLPIKTEHFEWSRETEAEILSEIDIGLNPLSASLREQGNPGLKILKYMSLGKPVISSPYGGAELYIQHSENGFFAKNKDDWYIGLRLLMEDESQRKEMGLKAREYVSKNFQSEPVTDKLFNILKGL